VGELALSEVEAALRSASVHYTIIGEMVDTASLPDGKLLLVN
jgi:hypothetical protein